MCSDANAPATISFCFWIVGLKKQCNLLWKLRLNRDNDQGSLEDPYCSYVKELVTSLFLKLK